MKRHQLAGQLSCRGDVLAISKFGLAAKVKTVYCTFARIMTAVIVLAFVDLSHLLTFNFEPIEIKQPKKLSDRCMKLPQLAVNFHADVTCWRYPNLGWRQK
jgi:hypothetical protein